MSRILKRSFTSELEKIQTQLRWDVIDIIKIGRRIIYV